MEEFRIPVDNGSQAHKSMSCVRDQPASLWAKPGSLLMYDLQLRMTSAFFSFGGKLTLGCYFVLCKSYLDIQRSVATRKVYWNIHLFMHIHLYTVCNCLCVPWAESSSYDRGCVTCQSLKVTSWPFTEKMRWTWEDFGSDRKVLFWLWQCLHGCIHVASR